MPLARRLQQHRIVYRIPEFGGIRNTEEAPPPRVFSHLTRTSSPIRFALSTANAPCRLSSYMLSYGLFLYTRVCQCRYNWRAPFYYIFRFFFSPPPLPVSYAPFNGSRARARARTRNKNENRRKRKITDEITSDTTTRQQKRIVSAAADD